MNRLFGLLPAALAGALAACGGEESQAAPRSLRVTAIPDSKGTDIQAMARLLESYLTEELGMPVRYLAVQNYKAAVDYLAAGKVDLVWYGGVTACDAVDMCKGEARIIACREKDLHFKSYFIANSRAIADGRIRPVTSLEELRPMLADASFTFGSTLSTSGHIMPRHFMVQAGIDPERDIKGGPKYQDSHPMTLQQVAQGSVDAGVLNYTHWDGADPATMRAAPIVYTTPEYVDYAWVAHDRLGQERIAAIRDAFITLDPENQAHKELLDALSAERFVAADPALWQGIRSVLADIRAKGIVK